MIPDRFKINPRRLRIGSGTSLFLREDGSFASPGGGTTTLVKYMDADQSTNTNTSLTNVTDLVFAIGANEVWVYNFMMLMGDQLSTTGFQMNYTAPAGASGWIIVGARNDANDDVYGEVAGSSVNNTMSFGAGFPIGINQAIVRAHIIVINGANAGNVQLQYAQQTSDPLDLTLKLGSYGVGHKVV